MSTIKSYILFFLGLLLVNVVLSSYVTAEKLSQVSIGVFSDYPPFVDKKLPGNGCATMLVQEAYKSMGVSTKIDWAPWKRAFNKVKSGKVDITFPWSYKKERALDFLFGDPIYSDKTFTWTRKGSYDSNFTIEASLKGKSICIPLGYGSFGKVDAMMKAKNLKRVTAKTMGSCFKLLQNKRVDAVDATQKDAGGVFSRSKGKVSESDFDKFLTVEKSYFLIVGKANPKAKLIIDTFNQGFKKIKSNGMVKKINDQYKGKCDLTEK